MILVFPSLGNVCGSAQQENVVSAGKRETSRDPQRMTRVEHFQESQQERLQVLPGHGCAIPRLREPPGDRMGGDRMGGDSCGTREGRAG